MRTIAKRLVKLLLRRMFQLMARLRLHVTPVRYDAAIPDVRQLARTTPHWNRPSAMPGVPIDVDAQLRACDEICRSYQGEFAGNRHYVQGIRRAAGPGYGYVEAQALHAVVRHLKPRRIVEVGSGVSTYCMLQALGRNGGPAELCCIDPYAPLRRSRRGLVPPNDEVRFEVIAKPVQHVPLEQFGMLAESDLLFIDSSHAVKAGSDVNFLVLEVLPRLKAGVWIHFHDIYFPYDFPRDLLLNYRFYNETSLLHAWLVHNPRAEIVFCLSLLHYGRPDALRAVFPDYEPQANDGGLAPRGAKPFRQDRRHFPSSIYIRTK